MPEWTPETGFEEAQRRIEACAETQSEELDLGGLQLTALPEGLWRLSWLKRLYLGQMKKPGTIRVFPMKLTETGAMRLARYRAL